jgi:hypothetical protein
MKFALQVVALALVVAGFCASAQAQAPSNPSGSGSWIFQRSYYSHDPVTTVRIAKPQVTGGPYYTRPQGAYVKSGFRNNNIVINVGSAGADVTNVWESWVQTGEQF